MNNFFPFSAVFGFIDSLFGMPSLEKDISSNENKQIEAENYWDPCGNLDLYGVSKRASKIIGQVNFLKKNPTHPTKQRTRWVIIGILLGALVSFVVPVFGIIIAAAPFFLVNFYFKNLSRDLLKIQLANKNDWLYDPTPDFKRYQVLKTHYPKIFKKGNQGQKIDDQFWGVNKFKRKDYFFHSGVFYYSIKKGKKTTSYNTHYLFIRLEKELKSEFLLSPEKKSIFNFFRSKEINTESEEFNKLFAFSYNGKKDDHTLEIVKSLSPAVQTKLTELAKEKGPFHVQFSKETILFLFDGLLMPNIKTNLFKTVNINSIDSENVEMEISSLIEVGTSIAKYLN